jgi:hypothetical protein
MYLQPVSRRTVPNGRKKDVSIVVDLSQVDIPEHCLFHTILFDFGRVVEMTGVQFIGAQEAMTFQNRSARAAVDAATVSSGLCTRTLLLNCAEQDCAVGLAGRHRPNYPHCWRQ